MQSMLNLYSISVCFDICLSFRSLFCMQKLEPGLLSRQDSLVRSLFDGVSYGGVFLGWDM